MRAELLIVLALALAALSSAEDYSGLDDDDYGNQVGKKPSGGGPMTYNQALQKAQKGEADQETLAVFRSAYEEVKRGYNDVLIMERKTNLAALLLDVANKEPDANVWTAMYKEAMSHSAEVLKVYPDDDAAIANAKAAKNSLAFRSKGMAQAVPEPEEDEPDEVKGARSFLFDEDEDEDDLSDQEGDDDEGEEEKEKVHIKDEDEEDEDEDDLPPPKKNTANAGAPGKSGSAATPPSKSLCDADSCSPLAEEWLGAWGKSSEAWAQVLQDIKSGKMAVVTDSLKKGKADAMRKAASGVKESDFGVKSSKDAFGHKRMHVVEASNKAFPEAIKELTNLLSGKKMTELLGQASGVVLDGPVVMELVWRQPGDHARLNRTGDDVTVDGSTYRTRVGFRLELPLDWKEEWGGETVWGDPLFAMAPKHNQMLFFPAGPAQAVLRVSSDDEVKDGKALSKAQHLVLEGWYTSSKLYDAKMLEKGYTILKSRAKGPEIHVAGHLINGASGVATPLKAN